MKSVLKVEERFGQSNSFVILKAAIGLFTPSSSEWEIQDYPKKCLFCRTLSRDSLADSKFLLY